MGDAAFTFRKLDPGTIESLLAAFNAANRDVMWVTSPDRRKLLYANHNYISLAPGAVEEIDPLWWVKTMSMDDRSAFRRLLSDLSCTGVFEQEVSLDFSGGEMQRCLCTAREFIEGTVWHLQRLGSPGGDPDRWERLQSALGCLDDMLWEWNVETGELQWAGKVSECLGIPGGGKPANIEDWEALIHPQDRARVAFARREAVSHCRPHREQYRVRHDSGAWRFWKEQGTPVADADGKVTWLVGAARDVTEQQRVQRAFEQNEAKLWDLLENTVECIWEVNQQGRFTFANARLTEAIGYRCDEIIDFRPTDLLPLEEARELLRAVGPFVRKARPFSGVRHPVRAKDGSRLVFETSGSPVFDRSGVYYGFRGTSRDVTLATRQQEVIRQSEKRYRQLLENASDAVFVLDSNGRFIELNPAFGRITGLLPSEWVGREFGAVVHPDDVHLAHGCFEKVAGGGTVPPFELRIRSAAGHWLTGEFAISAHYEEGQVVEVLGIGRDISDRKEFEARWSHIQKMESIGRLAGGVAHDFNNLLTIIKGFAELLKDDVSTEAGSKRLGEVLGSTERAIKLTRQLLTFSRRQPMQTTVFDLSETVRGMETMLTALAGTTVELKFDLADLPVLIEADPNQMEQVIMNLVINARDAMAEGGVVRITTAEETVDETANRRASLQPGAYIRLSVEDSGCGMSPEVKAHLFEPFFTTKDFGKGTGLGLATVYGIVKQSSGHVEVASEVGEGTRFDVFFPKYTPRSGKKPNGAPEGGTILVVDEDAAIRQMAADVLRETGYTVLEADNAMEALEKFSASRTPIDLLLSDMVMLKMSGYDLALKLREANPSLKVILMSGFGHADLEVARENETTPCFFLSKPLTATALVERVRAVLGKPS